MNRKRLNVFIVSGVSESDTTEGITEEMETTGGVHFTLGDGDHNTDGENEDQFPQHVPVYCNGDSTVNGENGEQRNGFGFGERRRRLK